MKLTILLIFVSVFCYGQKTKRIEVAKVNALVVTASIHYNENNQPSDTTFTFMGRDLRYTAITEIVVLKHGELDEITDLLQKCLEVFNEDPGTSITYEGSVIVVDEYLGVKNISLYGTGDDSRGYCALSKNWINKLNDKIRAFKNK